MKAALSALSCLQDVRCCAFLLVVLSVRLQAKAKAKLDVFRT